MQNIGIDGFNSYVAKNFNKKYKDKYRIYKFKYDINNIDKLKSFIIKNKISIFIRFAGMSRFKCEKYPKKCKCSNYKANELLVDFLKSKKIKLIFISSSHVYSNSNKKVNEKSKIHPNNMYGKYKLKSENYINKQLKNYLIIRVFNIYGKGQPKGYFVTDIKDKIKKNQIISINNSQRDFIHVDEVSRFLSFSISKDIKGVVNLGSGKSYKLVDIIKFISTKMKKKCKLLTSKTADKLVSDNKLINKNGFKVRYEKNFSF
jgi:nucleoside-diphosphate-sugar epimerase